MTKGNVGSLLVFDPEKITIDQPIKEASGDAVVGIVTERGGVLQQLNDQLHGTCMITTQLKVFLCAECRLSDQGGRERSELEGPGSQPDHDG